MRYAISAKWRTAFHCGNYIMVWKRLVLGVVLIYLGALNAKPGQYMFCSFKLRPSTSFVSQHVYVWYLITVEAWAVLLSGSAYMAIMSTGSYFPDICFTYEVGKKDLQHHAIFQWQISFVGSLGNWLVATCSQRLPSMRNSFGRLLASQSTAEAVLCSIFAFFYSPMVFLWV